MEELSVAANVFLGREKRTALGWIDDRAMAAECALLLDSLECRVAPDALTGHLRVGDQQLVEIAKALSLDASIVVMDEPTSAMDYSTEAGVSGSLCCGMAVTCAR